MTARWLVLLAACGSHAVPQRVPAPALAPRLAGPPLADPAARGAAYLAAVAVRLQPGWTQFLDDCRFRLAIDAPLNRMALAAEVELAVDAQGNAAIVALQSSGNTDFDRAVRDAVGDASPLPSPASELMSDDDRVHVRWLFARDRRQAGPATARVIDVEQPIEDVVGRRIAAGALASAARRLVRAPHDRASDALTTRVMVSVLREVLSSADEGARRVALEAIARGVVAELAVDVRGQLVATEDTEVRLAAVAAAEAVGDRDATALLADQLRRDLPFHPQLALAEAHALVALGAAPSAAAVLTDQLASAGSADPPPTAIEALAFVRIPDAAGRLAQWQTHGDARTRAAVCAAAVCLGAPPPWLAHALADHDATVRATCAATAAATHARDVIDRLVALARDRDLAVRARALAAVAALDPARVPHLTDDPAPEARAAFAAVARGDELHTMLDDRDPGVRAAAWQQCARLGEPFAQRDELVRRALRDAAPEVRLAVLPLLVDEGALARLADADPAPEVRGAALTMLAARRGRAAYRDVLLAHVVDAPTASVDRVHAALAWLLAR